jgi:hypothetical protein
MEQCLQQAESAPMGQAFMFAARSKAVSTPSRRAFASICAVASQVVKSRTSISFFLVGLTIFFSAMVSPLLGKHYGLDGCALFEYHREGR